MADIKLTERKGSTSWVESLLSQSLVKKRKQVIRTKGGNKKLRLLSVDTANLFDPKSKTFKQAKIKTITDNPANRHFIRRNIMTKGSVIDTEFGKAVITSRPGQDGVVNAVIVQEKN